MTVDQQDNNKSLRRYGCTAGFSLLEMMAVIDLILVLAVFALPGFHSAMVHAHEIVLREELFAVRCQIDRFTQNYEHGPASLEELVEKEYLGE